MESPSGVSFSEVPVLTTIVRAYVIAIIKLKPMATDAGKTRNTKTCALNTDIAEINKKNNHFIVMKIVKQENTKISTEVA